MGDGASVRPLRQGEPWTASECEQVVQDLAAGRSVAQIAARLQRTVAGVNGQIRHLVPDDPDVPRGARGRTEWLRRRLSTDPGYEWRTALRARAVDDAALLWTPEEDEQLYAGWHDAVPLPELASRLHMSEPAVVRRLVNLGLAEHVVGVVERLGAAPGGSVEARARTLRGELAEAVYILVVEHADRRPRVTVHHSREAAHDHVTRTLGDPSSAGRRWWVLRRTLDGRDVGQAWTNASRKADHLNAAPPGADR